MVGREAQHTRLAVCHVLRGWCVDGQVSWSISGDYYETRPKLYRIVGFEALGNTDTFQTATLELRLKQNGECVLFTRGVRRLRYGSRRSHCSSEAKYLANLHNRDNSNPDVFARPRRE